jgi:hypothetical protein
MLDSEPGKGWSSHLLYTHAFLQLPITSQVHAFRPYLVELALPLEAESLIDEELAEEGDDGHDDGNAAFVLVHLVFAFILRRRGLTQGQQLEACVSIF